MLVAQKWNVHRDAVNQRITEMCGVDLNNPGSSEELENAVEHLQMLRENWN